MLTSATVAKKLHCIVVLFCKASITMVTIIFSQSKVLLKNLDKNCNNNISRCYWQQYSIMVAHLLVGIKYHTALKSGVI